MIRQKVVSAFLAIMVMTTTAIPAFAATDAPIPVAPDNSGVSTWSYNKTFTLDFTQGDTWALDFDNEYALLWPHRAINVTYNSNVPYTVSGEIKVMLYIDDDGDGVYTLFEDDAGNNYIDTVACGESLSLALPYGEEIKNYRLVLQRVTTSITSANDTIPSFV